MDVGSNQLWIKKIDWLIAYNSIWISSLTSVIVLSSSCDDLFNQLNMYHFYDNFFKTRWGKILAKSSELVPEKLI